jgi:hypothetical protein
MCENVDWLHPSQVAGSCEHGNELSGPIKDEEFLDYVNDYQLLRKDAAVLGKLL